MSVKNHTARTLLTKLLQVFTTAVFLTKTEEPTSHGNYVIPSSTNGRSCSYGCRFVACLCLRLPHMEAGGLYFWTDGDKMTHSKTVGKTFPLPSSCKGREGWIMKALYMGYKWFMVIKTSCSYGKQRHVQHALCWATWEYSHSFPFLQISKIYFASYSNSILYNPFEDE